MTEGRIRRKEVWKDMKEGRMEERTEGRKDGRKEGRKEGRKRGEKKKGTKEGRNVLFFQQVRLCQGRVQQRAAAAAIGAAGCRRALPHGIFVFSVDVFP
jgi:hypothetical protein